jgi:hypothetical protein
MRDFFIECLQNLKAYRGLNQYEDYLSKGLKGANEMNQLIQAMVKVCNGFNYIPKEVQMRTIQKRIIDDSELYNLNAHKIWQWLNAISGKYWNGTDAEIMQPESNASELSPEFQDYLNRWFSEFEKNGINRVPEVSAKDIKAIENEDENRQQRKGLSTGMKYSTFDELADIGLKVQWAKECTNLLTGSIKPGCPTFEQWKLEREND